jgi:hypothetical protein
VNLTTVTPAITVFKLSLLYFLIKLTNLKNVFLTPEALLTNFTQADFVFAYRI